MSLQYWLPLNGNTNNQGLKNDVPTIVGTGITYSSGKIGQSATFPNNCASYIHLPGLNLQEGAFCAWIKILGEGSGNSYQYIISEGRDSNSIGTNIRVTKAGTSLAFVTHGKTININVELNKWFHIAGVFGDGKISLYKDGILSTSTTYTTDTDYSQSNDKLVLGKMSYGYTQTANYFPFNGQLNDVRIYNHALSAKEVEEISKGLILHYKLDDQYIESTTNLFASQIDTTCMTLTGFTANQNVTLSLDNINGIPAIKAISNQDTSTPGIKLGVYNLTTDTTYTVSCLLESNCTSNIVAYQITGATSKVRTIYEKVSFTFNTGSSTSITFYAFMYTPQIGQYIKISRPQLEQKDHATPFTISSRSQNTVYDSSGFNNNATATNIIVSNSSARCSNSFVFSGSSSYVKVTNNNWLTQGMQEITINFWAKCSSWPSNGGRMISCTETGGFNLEAGNSGYYRFPVHVYTDAEQTATAYKYDSKEIQISKLSTTNWNMITLIYTTSGTKTYINGQLHHTYTNASYGIHFNTNARLFLGCEANTASATTPYFNGQLNDLRIYTKELTAAQILELYNVSATIDNFGNAYSREVVEQ